MFSLLATRTHARRRVVQQRRSPPGRAPFRHLALAAPLSLMLAAIMSLFSLQASAAPTASQPQLSQAVELTTLASLGVTSSLLDTQNHYHLLYTINTPNNSNHNLIDLLYAVVSSDEHPVQLVKPITLAHAVDGLFSPSLILDSQQRFHAAWIERTNGVYSVRHALVEDQSAHLAASSIVPETLFQTNSFAEALSGGADASGTVFYSWLDLDSGSQTLHAIALQNHQSPGQPFVLLQPSTEVAFPHLAVYPNSTLAVFMQQRNPKGGWDITLTPYDASAHPLHDPAIVAQGTFPGSLNEKGIRGSDRADFRFDPLAVALDAGGRLHLAWGIVNQLDYASAVMQSDHGFAVQPAVLSSTTNNYQQLCLSVGPNTPPGKAAPTAPASPWLAWIDDSETVPMMPYIDQITSQQAFAARPTRLIPLTDAATNPCVQEDTHGHLYATWLQYDDNNQYGLFVATTARPPASSFWTKLGLSATAPIQQLIFIVLGSLLMGAFVALVGILAVPVIAGLVKLGQRLHTPRLPLWLLGLVPLLVIDILIQSYLAANFSTPTPPLLWPIVGSAVAVSVLLYLWFRSRNIPIEVLGTVGRVMLASYIASIILCMPIIYFTAPA